MQDIFKQSKLVNSNEFQVDEQFAQTLRRNLYEQYLNSQKLTVMDKIKSFFTNAQLRPLFAVVLVAFVAGAGLLYYQNTKITPAVEIKALKGYIADVDGTVELQKAGTEEWVVVAVGETVAMGDSIKTGDTGRAVIEIDNGDAVRLNSSTEVTLQDLMSNNIVIYQASGEVYSRVMKSTTNHYYVVTDDVETLALGTAYSVQVKPSEQTKVSTYESTVRVTYKQQLEEVSAQNYLEIDLQSEQLNLSEFTGTEYADEFVKWNVEKDEEKGYTTAEQNAPTLTVTAPANGLSTEAESVHVTGSATDDTGMKKIIVNGTIYMEMNEDGTGFDPATGTFDVVVPLNAGENTITVQAYDVYWNAAQTQTLTVTRTVAPGTTATPIPTNPPSAGMSIVTITSPQAGKIYVKWNVTGFTSSNGFKIVRSTSANPTYPNNGLPNWAYTYMSDANAREGYLYDVPAGTYHVRVCAYNGSTCNSYYTNDRTVTVAGDSVPTFTSMTATYTGSNSVQVSWSLSGAWTTGYKVVWDTNANPTYPEDSWHYVFSTSDTVTGLTSGQTYHFRVCLYNGGCSDRYSVDRSVAIPALPTATPVPPTSTPEPTPTP